MYKGKIIFSQIMDFLPMHEFRKCVKRYQGNYKVMSVWCLDQFLCLVFAKAHFSRKSSWYRSLSPFDAKQAVPYGYSWQNIRKYSSWCQRKKGLAYLLYRSDKLTHLCSDKLIHWTTVQTTIQFFFFSK